MALPSASAVAQSPTDFSAIDAREKACEMARLTVDGSAVCEQEAQAAADRAEIVQRLIVAERAWVVFRDAECGYESTVAFHAPLEGYEYQSCRYQQTKARIKALLDPAMPQNAR